MKKNHKLNFFVCKDQKEQLLEVSELLDLPLSQFVRAVLNNALGEILYDLKSRKEFHYVFKIKNGKESLSKEK